MRPFEGTPPARSVVAGLIVVAAGLAAFTLLPAADGDGSDDGSAGGEPAPATADASSQPGEDLADAGFAEGPVFALPSFTVLDATYNSGLYTSLQQGPDGLPAVSYYDDTNGALRFARCLDHGCRDFTSRVVDDEGVTGLSTSLAFTADGLPVISYYDLELGAVRLAWCGDADCADATLVTVDRSVPDVTRTALTIAPDGRAEIAYAAGPEIDDAALFLSRCRGEECERQLVEGPGVGDHIASARDGDRLVLVFRDELRRLLRVARCDATCEVSSPDSTAGGGLQPDVTIGPDGAPVIVHLDLSGRALRLLRCVDPDCTGAEVAVLADTPGAGFFPSVALRADGSATVAYYDEGTRALWVAACPDIDCTEVRRNVVDALGIVGVHASMILDPDGLPVVAYHDQTNRHLKVAGCASPSCDAPIEAATLGMGTVTFLDDDGRPGLVYRSSRPRDIRVARCRDGACNRASVVPADSGAFVGLHGSGASAPDGTSLVAYFDTAAADLRLAACDTPPCAFLEASTLAATGNVGAFATMVVDGSRLAVAHQDRTRHQVRLITCDSPSCAVPHDVKVADVGRGAGELGLAYHDGTPVIAYQHPGTGDLHLVVCADAPCEDKRDVTVAREVGPLPVELAVAGDGTAWILHRDAAAGSLRLVHCRLPDCTDPTGITVATDGVEASLALADEVPLVAYLAEGRGLVVGRCTDRPCGEVHDEILATDVGLATSLAVTSSGQVVIGTLELGSGAPILLRCPDARCARTDRVPLLSRTRG